MTCANPMTLPAFPNALIATTTSAPLLFAPQTTSSAYSQSTSFSQTDPFAARQGPWTSRSIHLLAGSRDAASSDPVVIAFSPMQSLKDIRTYLDAAQTARSDNDRKTAADKYQQALELLEKPSSPESDAPFYSEIVRGSDLFKEALFGTAGFSGSERAAEIITRLTRYIDNPSDNAPPLDLAKAKLLKAYTLLQYAASAHEPQISLFDRALRLTDEAVNGFPSDHEANDDVIFFGNLLSIEILSRLLVHAHNRSDHKQEFTHAEKIKDAFRRITEPNTPPERLDLIGEYKADVATLMARIGLWGPALEMARRLTGCDSPFKDTPAAQRLFSEQIFQPLVEDDGARKVFLDAGELRLRSREHAVRRRALTAIAYAYSESLKQTAVYGGIGLVTGIIADLVLLQGGYNLFAGALGAAIATAYNRLRNGWTTPEAVYAGEIGTDARTWQQSAADVTGFIIKSGISAVPWVIPAALIDAGMDGVNIATDTLSRAGDLYYRFGKWAVTSAPALVQPETYTGLFDSISNMDATQIAYRTYTGAAGLLYAVNLLSSKSRRFTDRWAWLLLPGAIMLSADLGMLINPNKSKIDRVERSMIVAVEMMLLMLTNGLLPLENRSSTKKVFQSIGRALNPIGKDAKYALPLTAALLANVGSAMGGMMQKGTDPNTLPFTLTAIQGAATTFGLLGIVLGLSGILKGTIPIGPGIKEGWQDSAGESAHRRIASMIMGALGAFNYPYGHNRLGRSATWDLPAAALRTVFGWDSNAGQISMSATNFGCGNGISTATWPETGGTMWERDAVFKLTTRPEDAKLGWLSNLLMKLGFRISANPTDANESIGDAIAAIEKRRQSGELTDIQARALTQERLAKLHDFVSKAGHVMDPLHIFMPHGSIWPSLWPLASWTRGGFLPNFPHVPNRYLYANLHQLLNGGDAERLDDSQVHILLQYVGAYGHDANHHRHLRPLVQTLALARASKDHGEKISDFFNANPWLEDLFDVDLKTHEPPSSRYRRKVRAAVRKATKVRFDKYEEWTKSHDAQQRGADHLDGMFTVRPHDPKPTKVAGSAVSTQGSVSTYARAGKNQASAKSTRKR